MRKYLSELHKKPDHHKKQFALLTSGTITLFIFGIWSVVNFGVPDAPVKVAEEKKEEIGVFDSLRLNLAASLTGIKENFMDLESKYTELRDGTLDIYGQ